MAGHKRLARTRPAVPRDAAGCQREVDGCAANAEVDEVSLAADSSELAAVAGADTRHTTGEEDPGGRAAVAQQLGVAGGGGRGEVTEAKEAQQLQSNEEVAVPPARTHGSASDGQTTAPRALFAGNSGHSVLVGLHRQAVGVAVLVRALGHWDAEAPRELPLTPSPCGGRRLRHEVREAGLPAGLDGSGVVVKPSSRSNGELLRRTAEGAEGLRSKGALCHAALPRVGRLVGPPDAPKDGASEALQHAEGHSVAKQLSAVQVPVRPRHGGRVEALRARGLTEREVPATGESPHAATAGACQARDPRLRAARPPSGDTSIEDEVDRRKVDLVAGAPL